MKVIRSGFLLNGELTRFADLLIKHSCLEAGCNNRAGSKWSPFGKRGSSLMQDGNTRLGSGFDIALLEKKKYVDMGQLRGGVARGAFDFSLLIVHFFPRLQNFLKSGNCSQLSSWLQGKHVIWKWPACCMFWTQYLFGDRDVI